ncbi:unnamed protein product [Sphenostylis stenocarpa]|uniref:Uncharacterized protein n=1 Tax=Sphenostylis stenocarpa TaxID=92480 RepID=A0AA86SS50_9FABA|nr:unnamed protein product [Sphenostylis stenocarpa]
MATLLHSRLLNDRVWEGSQHLGGPMKHKSPSFAQLVKEKNSDQLTTFSPSKQLHGSCCVILIAPRHGSIVVMEMAIEKLNDGMWDIEN